MLLPRPLQLAASTDRCNTDFKFLCWRLVFQGLSRSFVELTRDGAESSLTKARYISAFWEFLPKMLVGILVATALPCIARQAIASAICREG